jgi:hypothetical protein
MIDDRMAQKAHEYEFREESRFRVCIRKPHRPAVIARA